ncbi:DUF885 domain-containing protein [Sessilibacter sp. MAH1]
MKTFKKLLLTSAVAATSLAMIACSPSEEASKRSEQVSASESAPASTSEKTEQEKLISTLEQFYEEDLKRSPLFASYRGSKEGYGLWNDISLAKQDEEHELDKTRLAILEKFDASQLDDQNKITLAISKAGLERSIAQYEFRDNDYVMQQFRSWHTTVPSLLINIHRVSSEQDLKDYLSRLEKVAPLFDQTIDLMRHQAGLGVYPPRWTYPQMIEASKNVITGVPFDDSETENPIFADFSKKLASLELTEEASDAYLAQVTKILKEVTAPAYEKLIAELEVQQAKAPEGDGVWRLPKGDAYYAQLLNYYTTTNLSAEEIHQLGLDNVKRIHSEMEVIKDKVGFKGSLQDFFKFMREDSQFFYPETDEGRDQYLAKSVEIIDTMRDALPNYFGIFPKAEINVKRVEPFREKSAGKAFYQGPPPDGSRPGIYYVNLYRMADMPTYQMEALAYHEGIPGHHMQLAITAELEGIPEFQKTARFTAFTEGWGLYSEYLGKEMGFYQDPYSDFGRLAMELWRACRLVVDSGIHAKQWSREQAIQYLQDNTPNPENDTVKAIERYIVYPGQATAYLVGKIKILELREYAKEQLGDKFDIKAYHDLVLKDGPMPLSMLEDKVNAWIETVK